jgi:hypothetical protein
LFSEPVTEGAIPSRTKSCRSIRSCCFRPSNSPLRPQPHSHSLSLYCCLISHNFGLTSRPRAEKSETRHLLVHQNAKGRQGVRCRRRARVKPEDSTTTESGCSVSNPSELRNIPSQKVVFLQ